MASSRLLPLSYNLKSFGNVSRDYTLLSTWESDTDNDLVTASKGEVLECYPDEVSYDQFVSIGGATTNSNYFRVIKSKYLSNKAFFSYTGTGSAVYVLNANEDYLGIYDIDATYVSGTSTPSIYRIADVDKVKIIGCRGKNSNTGTTVFGIYSLVGAGKITYVINCMVSNVKTYGYRLSGAGTGYFYNCTSFASNGFSRSLGTAIAINCCSASAFNGTWTTTTCIVSSDIIYVNTSNYDLHLSSADITAKNMGTDLSSDLIFPFSDDYDGKDRPYGSAWDAGAHEWYSRLNKVRIVC